MPRYREIKSSFLGGELSPKMNGRVDLPQYLQGCHELTNMLVMPQGGVTRRPGTQRVATLTAADGPFRLIPFVASDTDAKMIILGPSKYWIAENSLTNSGVSGVGRTVTEYAYGTSSYPGYTYTNPGYTAAELTSLQYAQVGDVVVLVCATKRPMCVIRSAGAFSFSALNAALLSVIPPLSTASISTALVNSYPYLEKNSTNTTITPSATTGNGITLTASAALFNAGHVDSYFQITHSTTTGYARITSITSATVAIGNVVPALPLGGTTATLEWAESAWSDYRGHPRTIAFYEGRLWLASTAHQPDTYWFSQIGDITEFKAPAPTATSDAAPSIANSVRVNGIRNDDAFSFTPPSGRMGYVQWMEPLKFLTMGTTSVEQFLSGGNQGLSFGPHNPGTVHASSYGSCYVQAKSLGRELFFVGLDGQTVRALSESTADTGDAANLSLLADHLTTQNDAIERVTCIQVQKKRETLWCITDAGNLIGVTRDKNQNLTAWHKHPIAGTSAAVKSIACAPSSDGRYDELWMVVTRTVSGSTVWTLEVMADQFPLSALNSSTAQFAYAPYFTDASHHRVYTPKTITGATQANPVVITSAAHGFTNGQQVRISGVGGMTQLNGNIYTVANAAANTFELSGVNGLAYGAYTSGGQALRYSLSETGLTWLAGTTVALVGDGVYLGTATVSGAGAVTLPSSPANLIVGLPYTSRVRPTRVEAGSAIGSAQGAIKRHDRVVARFYRTAACSYGSSSSSTKVIDFRPASVALDSPIPLFTGDKKLDWPGDYDENPDVVFQTSDPLPMTIVSIITQGVEYDV